MHYLHRFLSLWWYMCVCWGYGVLDTVTLYHTPSASASRVAEVTGVCHHAGLFSMDQESKLGLCCVSASSIYYHGWVLIIYKCVIQQH